MRLSVSSAAPAAMLWIVVLSALGQSGGSGSTGTRPVRAYVTATRGGVPATDLPTGAFAVLEDGKRQQIASVERFRSPVSWCLVIDSSNSVRPTVPRIHEIELALLDAIPPEDEACVIHFNVGSYMDSKLTRDRAEIQRAFTRLDPRGPSTVLDATMSATRYLMPNAANERKVVVLISDGRDNDSKVTSDALVAALLENDVSLYSLTLDQPGGPSNSVGWGQLDSIVKPTGGVISHASSVNELRKAAVRIPVEVHSQYVLTYLASGLNIDRKARKIQVELQGVKGVKARTKSAYFPPSGAK